MSDNDLARIAVSLLVALLFGGVLGLFLWGMTPVAGS